ncbi:ABC transporter family substrate-binding protein [Nocardioidaceae bacterium]|nr:ABC transporter family substrate-binding protein [Nocardioidaceae bacterium]
MIQKKFLAASAVATLALSLAACSAPETSDNPSSGDNSDGGGASTGGSVNVGWNQPFYSYNEATSDGNASANAVIKTMVVRGFNYYNEDLELVKDESFGTYEQVSEDPLTVKWTINDDVNWSDGTPVDAADMMLWWAAGSGNVNTKDSVEGDNGVYFDTSSAGLPFITEIPEIGDDGKSITVTYDEPFADWELDFGLGSMTVPAHATVQQALDIADPQEAKDTLISAIQEGNNNQLAQIANFWNDGYDFKQLPDDESLYLSNGPYVLTDMQENQFATLEKNPEYTGELEGNLDQITVIWNEDPNSQLQQLQNGEIDAMQPQVTSDLIQAAEGSGNIEVTTAEEAAYEHFDLVYDNGGPFDPAAYGGDEETAQLVREAFMAAFPRQEIVEKLIQPVDPEAVVRDSFTKIPGAPGYDEVAANNGTDAYAQADPERAQQLLEQAGVDTPIDVRMMYAADNERRSQLFQIVQPRMAEVGFNLIDRKNIDWGSKLGDGTYDSVFFAWASTSTAVTESSETYRTGGLNNLNGYSNETVDEAYQQLAVSQDEAEQDELLTTIESELVDDAYGLTLFQFPSATFVNTDRIDGIETIAISPTMFYGFWDWSIPSN